MRFIRSISACMALLAVSYSSFAQSSQGGVRDLLLHIASLQNKEGNNQGLFPSLREYHFRIGTFKTDENIFFTALIVWTLRRQIPYLNETEKVAAESIITAAAP